MRRDDVNINKVIEEAGMLSRMGARVKAAGGAVKTAISGTEGWKGKYKEGKQEEILKTLSNDIVKNLEKLGLVDHGSYLNSTDLQKMLTKYVSTHTGVGGTPTAPASTAPVPTAPVPTAPVPTPPVPTAPVPTAPVPTAPVPTAPVTTSTKAPAKKSKPVLPPEPIPFGEKMKGSDGTGKKKFFGYYSSNQVGSDNMIKNVKGNPKTAKWYELSVPNKNGESKMAFDAVDDETQSEISIEWKKRNAEQKKLDAAKRKITFSRESFKNYFWK